MNEPGTTVSFVVPLFNTGKALPALMEAFRSLQLDDSWELILVDDGSGDQTARHAALLLGDLPQKVTLVELARNYGEHAAVLEGYRHTSGEFVINLDDDLQNPLAEALRLLRQLQSTDADVVYARYPCKCHHWLRNAGSRAVNALATLLLEKPPDIYLSSFRALRRSVVQRVAAYRGPFPYIDALILGATNRIERLEVVHVPRADGCSGYTVRKLVRLAMNVCFDSSIMPLRVASLLGAMLCCAGGVIVGDVLVETFLVGRRQIGWGSLMGALTIFSGAQLVMLGLIGEYVGRAFLTVSGKPQSFVRTVTVHQPAGT